MDIRFIPVIALALMLAACQSPAPRASNAAVPAASAAGEYDNHEQVWSARENPALIAPPHVHVTVEATPRTDWTIWRVQLDATPPIEASWALRTSDADGALVWLPHRALVAGPGRGAAFDPAQWTALDACALRGRATARGVQLAADARACAVLAPGVGPMAALLPLDIEREGDALHVRFYVDQARGTDARESLRRVRRYEGWAALNGAGPTAAADSNDWHTDRKVSLGNEGGRYALAYRDGRPSGYSLLLERLSYRDGNVPVLKLSVVDDATGRTLAYAWANPEATSIGINLGWVQVGLESSATIHPASP
ncbi:hypothetical protein [Dokdonella fugitiva]|uniref:hypothetical protein n=1 Tax=Dokdonella fugitiva TaxID=328517 RepID=UPI0015F89B88|nr:hypothetical protein [Dokdonella fugitiva]MBA8883371.1 hypothetical protein [Dokdonella fugitiva]